MKDLAKLNTKYNFDAIETFNNCDFPRANSVFACGSYSLNEKTKIRSGAIAMYNFGQSSPVQISFAKFDFAVTDLKWQPFSDFISSANSDGSVKIFRAEPSNSFGLELLLNFDLSNSSLALSLDWSPFDNKAIVASLSDGHIGLIDLENHSIDKFRAHNAEVWNVVFDSENPFVVYSGSDDASMKIWDMRSKSETSSKNFEYGVCSIAPDPHHGDLIAVGGYDQHVRIFDKRNIYSPVNSFNIGGGVWRLKWHKHLPGLLLVSGMRSGCHVIESPSDLETAKIMSYRQHGDSDISKAGKDVLCYASDWLYLSNLVNDVVSSTFYQGELRFWQN